MSLLRARVVLAERPWPREALRAAAPPGAAACRLAASSRAGTALGACGSDAPPDAALGPLALAAFRRAMEPRDVGFALTLGSLGEDGRLREAGPLRPGEAESVAAEFGRLAGRRLTLIEGVGADHAALWARGSLDLGCTDWADAVGRPYAQCLPEGDGERMLRMLVEDSVDLLDGLPANRARREDGLAPANVLWPWSPGFPISVENIPMRLGRACALATDDWAFAGAGELCGYLRATPGWEGPGLLVWAGGWELPEDPEEAAFEASKTRGSGWLASTAGLAVAWPGGGAAWPWEGGVPLEAVVEGAPSPVARLDEWLRGLSFGSAP